MPGILLAVALTASLLIVMMYHRLLERASSKWRFIITSCVNVIAALLGGVLAVVKKGWGGIILNFLSRLFGVYGMRCFVCVCVIGFGVAAYLWKQKNQRTYGMSEVLFGIVAGTFVTFTLAPDKSLLSQWVGLGGAAYIIARGLNNVAEAKAKVLRVAA